MFLLVVVVVVLPSAFCFLPLLCLCCAVLVVQSLFASARSCLLVSPQFNSLGNGGEWDCKKEAGGSLGGVRVGIAWHGEVWNGMVWYDMKAHKRQGATGRR